MTEEQIVKIMTKRRACIDKFRKTLKSKPAKKVLEEVVLEETTEIIEEPKKKRTYKKKAKEPVPEEGEEPKKKPTKRISKKKVLKEPIQEASLSENSV